MTQLPLFPPRRRRVQPTSLAAYREATARSTTAELRAAILARLVGDGPLTDDALAAALGADLYDVRRRRSDLTREGLVNDSGLRGQSARGCAAIKWQVAPPDKPGRSVGP